MKNDKQMLPQVFLHSNDASAACLGCRSLVFTYHPSLYRPLRQQDGVRDSWHWLAAAANLPQGDAEKDSSEHPGRVLPPRVRRPPLGDAHTKGCPPDVHLQPRHVLVLRSPGVRGHSWCLLRWTCWFLLCIFFFVKRCVLIVFMSSLQCIVNSISFPIYLCMLLPYYRPSYFQ